LCVIEDISWTFQPLFVPEVQPGCIWSDVLNENKTLAHNERQNCHI